TRKTDAVKMTSADINLTFFTENNGSRSERTFRKSQVTVSRLSTVFKIDQASLFITEEFSGPSEFPDSSGNFPSLDNVRVETVYEVEGDSLTIRPIPSTPNTPSTSAYEIPSSSSDRQGSSSSPEFGAFRRYNLPGPAHRKRARASQDYLLKIFLGDFEGRKIVSTNRMQHISINASNSNVNAITEMARNVFQIDDLVLASASGCIIEDTEVTRDFTFWRSAARKIYAVQEEQFQRQPTSTAQRASSDDNANREIIEKLDSMERTIERNSLIPNIRNISGLENAIWSTRLIEPVKETFRCVICRDISSSPIEISECCKQILGCSTCLHTYTGSSCPLCRSENFSKMRLNCFENLLRL
uniref:RING-type domain-containing protein n=1 Tax=Clytia hemisphaerica TaxID=252671 RepID=A0A7M5XEW9_9CNID